MTDRKPAKMWSGECPKYNNGAVWKIFKSRLEQFFVSNDISDVAMKRAMLLSQTGEELANKLWDLATPNDPQEKTYLELIELLDKYFLPPDNKLRARFNFHSRSRLPGEKVSEFGAAIKALTRDCKFGTAEDEQLLERLLMGINSPHIQKALLNSKKDKYQEMLDLAISLETTDEDLSLYQKGAHSGFDSYKVEAVSRGDPQRRNSGYTSGRPDSSPKGGFRQSRDSYSNPRSS